MIPRYNHKDRNEGNELDLEQFISNADQNRITKINEMGRLCFSLLKEVQMVESLTQALLEKLSEDISENQVNEDIEEFLNILCQCELILNGELFKKIGSVK